MLNKCLLIGNLGADPEMRYTASGAAIAKIRLATSEKWKDKTTGEKQEKTEWHACTAFGKQAELLGEYCRKGQKLYVEGRIQTRQWEDDEGKKRYSTEIIVREFLMLDSASAGAKPETPKAPEAVITKSGIAGAAPATQDFDDEIPF